jgi:hypothetical protein
LEKQSDFAFTMAFVGQDLRKISAGDGSRVIDEDGQTIGTVLTCATDMGIGYHNGKIVSIASPDKPEGFKAKGLCCGFIKVDRKLPVGRHVDIATAGEPLPSPSWRMCDPTGPPADPWPTWSNRGRCAAQPIDKNNDREEKDESDQ